MKRRLKFAAALLLAAAFSDIARPDPYRRGWRALRALFGYSGKGGKVTDAVYDKRMECCRGCEFYHNGLETCGSPLADRPEFGCWCFLPVKNRLSEATCWADENMDNPPHSWNKWGAT